MIPTVLIIEELKRRERERGVEGIPLHAPSPVPSGARDDRDEDADEEKSGGTVIIIDMVDNTEIRI